MRLHLHIVFLIALIATGCSSTLKPAPRDPATGLFPTNTKLSSESVKILQPFDEKYRTLVYVKTDESKAKQYNDFFGESLKNMGTFKKVVTKEDLEKMVVTRNLTDKVSNISDLIGLNQLAKQIGPFLIVQPYVEVKQSYNFFAHLKAIDPETGTTVLLLEQTAFNWAGLDEPLFFPLMNGFMQWTQGMAISTSPK